MPFSLLLVLLFTGTPQPTAAGQATEATRRPPVPYLVDVTVVLRATASQNQPQTALLLEPTGESTLTDPLGVRWNAAELLDPAPRASTRGAFMLVGAELEPREWILLHALLDSGELRPGSFYDPAVDATLASDGRPLDEAARSTAFVREAELELSTRSFTLAVGRRRRTLAQGIIYDDYSTGLRVEADLSELTGVPVQVRGSASLLGPLLELTPQASSLLALELAYEPSLFESVNVLAASFQDRDGALNDLVRSAVAERIVATRGEQSVLTQELLSQLFLSERGSSGRVSYVGASWSLLPVAGVRLRGAATLARGDLHVDIDTQALQLRLSSWAGALEASCGITSRVSIGAFGFALSGDEAPALRNGETDYRAFVAVAPYWTWTGLFFSGGLSQGFFAGRATAAGINGHGVAGGGLGVETAWESGGAELRVAYLRAMQAPSAPPFGGTGMDYGVEVDLYGEHWVTKWLAVGAEMDLLRAGSFFAERALAWRVIGQAYIYWGS